MRKIIPVLVLLLLTFSTVSAQNWGGGLDDEPVNFGFTFQYTNSNYIVQKKANWRERFRDPETNLPLTDSLSALYGKSSPGFGVGFVINGRISSHLDLRMSPTLVFAERLMQYDYLQPGTVNMPFSNREQKVSATLVEIPLGIKIKSNRRNNFRAYMLYGAKYSFDISSKKKTDDSEKVYLEKLLKNKSGYFSAEAAFGLDFYFEYFKMSPEVKLSYSLNNILDNTQPNPYNRPIDRLMLRNVTFSLFFE